MMACEFSDQNVGVCITLAGISGVLNSLVATRSSEMVGIPYVCCSSAEGRQSQHVWNSNLEESKLDAGVVNFWKLQLRELSDNGLGFDIGHP